MVFLHGWPEWSGIWRKVLPGLETRFDVIAPDLRNFGDSRGDEARNVDHFVSDLEALVDEYYEAAGVDPRRIQLLRDRIVELTRSSGLDLDCGIGTDEPADEALAKLDNYLCELKEMQIRDGLHIFGQSPDGALRTGLLVALARMPRGDGDGANASLLRALCSDLGLAFDPLNCDFAMPWTGAKPSALSSPDPTRTAGDVVAQTPHPEGSSHHLVGGGSGVRRLAHDARHCLRVESVPDTV